jgi:hypothetical protein
MAIEMVHYPREIAWERIESIESRINQSIGRRFLNDATTDERDPDDDNHSTVCPSSARSID